MGLSVRGLSAYQGTSSVSAMNYALSNGSAVSSAFSEAVQESGRAEQVDLVSPVRYANAQLEVNPAAQVERSQEAEAAYNSVAQSFNGVTTGYSRDSMASSYDMLGSNLDLYA